MNRSNSFYLELCSMTAQLKQIIFLQFYDAYKFDMLMLASMISMYLYARVLSKTTTLSKQVFILVANLLQLVSKLTTLKNCLNLSFILIDIASKISKCYKMSTNKK